MDSKTDIIMEDKLNLHTVSGGELFSGYIVVCKLTLVLKGVRCIDYCFVKVLLLSVTLVSATKILIYYY